MGIRAVSLGVVAAFVATAPALAAPTADQSNVTTFTNAPGNTVGASGLASRPNQDTTQRWQAQTIVAGLTGQLSAIDLQVFTQSNRGSLLVTLGTGELTTAGYTAIGTITVPYASIATEAMIRAGGFTSVNLAALNYFVTPGQVFTVTLAEAAPLPGFTGNFSGWVFGELDANGDFVSSPDYAPGVARFSTDSGQTWTVAGADRGFRTFVNVVAAGGVPEPSTWGLMILGLGAVGVGLRRRSAIVAAHG